MGRLRESPADLESDHEVQDRPRRVAAARETDAARSRLGPCKLSLIRIPKSSPGVRLT